MPIAAFSLVPGVDGHARSQSPFFYCFRVHIALMTPFVVRVPLMSQLSIEH
jgi:hypothetical protein